MDLSKERMNIGMVSLEESNKMKNEISNYESLLDKKMSTVLRFISWEDNFPETECQLILESLSDVVLTWELIWPTKNPDDRRNCPVEDTGLDEVLSGTYDDYIDSFAKNAKKFKKIVYTVSVFYMNLILIGLPGVDIKMVVQTK